MSSLLYGNILWGACGPCAGCSISLAHVRLEKMLYYYLTWVASDPILFSGKNVIFFCKIHKGKNLVFMKVMPMSSLRNTWNVKVYSELFDMGNMHL